MARPFLSFWFWDLLHCKSPNPPLRSRKTMTCWTQIKNRKNGARFVRLRSRPHRGPPIWMALGTKESCHKSLSNLNNFAGSTMVVRPLFSDASKKLLVDSVGGKSLTAFHLCFSCAADSAMQHSTWCELDQWWEPLPQCHGFLSSILHLHVQR